MNAEILIFIAKRFIFLWNPYIVESPIKLSLLKINEYSLFLMANNPFIDVDLLYYVLLTFVSIVIIFVNYEIIYLSLGGVS